MTAREAGPQAARRGVDRTLPGNLRLPRSPLVGREHELAAIQQSLITANIPLLTLTGPGGIGKTRLARQAAANVRQHFTDGTYFVSLAPVQTPGLVVAAIAEVLGLHETAGRPLQDSLEAYLQHRELLLVLDNFEHVAAAASNLASLLVSCPGLKLLVTSRVILHLYDEHEFPVPCLSLPDQSCLASLQTDHVGDLTHYAAIDLFIQRAIAAKPDFVFDASNAVAVAEICMRLDGLPLAIELAAARIKVFPAPTLLARLDQRLSLLTGGAIDLPLRQRTLRDEIGWSYDLLSPAERRLFYRLSVFAGGFTLHAAQDVAGQVDSPAGSAGGTPSLSTQLAGERAALDVVTSLVEHNLLRLEHGPDGEPRFSMLETIREYGWELLTASGERDDMCRRHANFFLACAEALERQLQGPQRLLALGILQAEIHNIRAALRWSQTVTPDDETGLRLVGALTWFWHFGNHVNEARGWVEEALRLKMAAPRTAPTPEHAKALWGAGMIAMIQGDYPLARVWLEESAARWQQLGDQNGLAAARRELAVVALFLGDAASARLHAEESVALYRALDRPWDLALSVHNLGYALDAQSDHDRAFALFEECHAQFKALDDTWGLSVALGALGFSACRRSDYATARGYFEEALALRRASADKWNIAEGINLLGEVVERQGDLEHASSLYAECLKLDYEVGDKARIALVLHHLGVIAQRKGRCARAARLLAAADGLRSTISGAVFLTLTAGNEYEQDIAEARSACGEAVFAAEWAQGYTMRLEQAIEYGLAELGTDASAPHNAELRAKPALHGYPTGLTAREVEVLHLLTQGLTYRQIADQLFVSRRTVNAHISSIYTKLGVNSRAEAAHYVTKHQL